MVYRCLVKEYLSLLEEQIEEERIQFQRSHSLENEGQLPFHKGKMEAYQKILLDLKNIEKISKVVESKMKDINIPS